MNVLLLDTSSKGLYVGLSANKEYIECYKEDCGITHSEVLLKSIDEVLKKKGLGINDVDVFSVTVGPGSFTGLRIAACTVKGFLLFSGAKVVCCNTLECVAYNYLGEKRKVLTLIDAKHDNAFCGLYEAGEQLMPLEIGFFHRDKVEKLKREADVTVSNYDNSFGAEKVNSQKDGFYKLTMDKIAASDFSDENFEVLYLKRSQAEEEYEGNM